MESIQDIITFSQVNWHSPDHKAHKLFKERGFDNYRGKLRIDNVIFDYIEKIMKNTGEKISSGDIAVNPVNGLKAEACKYCEYSIVCGIEDEEIFTVQNADSTAVIESIKEEAYATETDA